MKMVKSVSRQVRILYVQSKSSQSYDGSPLQVC